MAANKIAERIFMFDADGWEKMQGSAGMVVLSGVRVNRVASFAPAPRAARRNDAVPVSAAS
jgi:hypothetical protein